MRRPPIAALLLVPPLIAGCELQETQVAPVAPGIVVHAVMRPDQPVQFVLVERLFDGVVEAQKSVEPVPPGGLQTPVTDATVTVTNIDLPADTCGAAVTFDRMPVPGVYWSRPGCPTMRPGDRLALEVDVPGLGTVRGVTRVPGLEGSRFTVGNRTASAGDTIRLNRDRESLDIAIAAQFHRALQIIGYRVGTAPPGAAAFLEDRIVALELLVDSTQVTVPGTVRLIRGRGTAEPALRGGRRYEMVAGVTDSNYYDFARSSNNGITGRGFINRLTGGIGVFGSMVAAPFTLEVTADTDDEREGTYLLTGELEGVAVDVEVTLYLAPAPAAGELSGFARGTWLFRTLGAEGAAVTRPRNIDGQSVDGRFDADTLRVVIPTLHARDGPRLSPLTVKGVRNGSQPFTARVTEPLVAGTLALGSLTVTPR